MPKQTSNATVGQLNIFCTIASTRRNCIRQAPRAYHMSNSINQKINELRQEYRKGSLLRENLDPNPFAQFEKWFDEAVNAAIRDANAMTLSTIGLDGIPNARTVLMKDFTEDGVTFFTNRHSNKGKELAASPVATHSSAVRADGARTTRARSDSERPMAA